jgi:hypothetical protein
VRDGDDQDEDETRIVLHGLDPVAHVALNGVHLLTAENAFHPHTILLPSKNSCISGLNNRLEITFPAQRTCLARRAADHGYREWNDPVGGISRLRTPQYKAGWDWGPRLLTPGITGHVSIVRTPVARIHDLAVLQTHHPIHTCTTTTTNNTHDAAADSERFPIDAPSVTLQFLVDVALKPGLLDNIHCVVSINEHLPSAKTTELHCLGQHESTTPGNTSGLPSGSALTIFRFEGTLTIDKPRLWWPNGYGDQCLYDVKLLCRLRAHEEDEQYDLDSRNLAIGLRTIQLVRECTPGLKMCDAGSAWDLDHEKKAPEQEQEDANAEQQRNSSPDTAFAANQNSAGDNGDSPDSPSPAEHISTDVTMQDESFTFVVNGRRIFAKGANFIPTRAIFSDASAEDYDIVIAAAVEANMNMLRVWGGGSYEKDEFYDRCDRSGILVWQDFMFSCALYPGDRDFLESCRTEARYQVARLRNRACMALWCGMSQSAH